MAKSFLFVFFTEILLFIIFHGEMNSICLFSRISPNAFLRLYSISNDRTRSIIAGSLHHIFTLPPRSRRGLFNFLLLLFLRLSFPAVCLSFLRYATFKKFLAVDRGRRLSRNDPTTVESSRVLREVNGT